MLDHSGHARNVLPIFGLPIKDTALCHSIFVSRFPTLTVYAPNQDQVIEEDFYSNK